MVECIDVGEGGGVCGVGVGWWSVQMWVWVVEWVWGGGVCGVVGGCGVVECVKGGGVVECVGMGVGEWSVGVEIYIKVQLDLKIVILMILAILL